MGNVNANMNDTNNTFNLHGLKQHAPGHSFNADFEARVFAKIKRKKAQRKVAASAALSIAVIAVIFVGQAVLFHQDPREKILVGHNGRNGQNMQNMQIETSIKAKEEVPVMENVVFASYDQQNDYAIEQVAYNQHENTI
ncbi:MAG: hypothetical protein QG657_4444 [Acidobacteriota bacterium]|nr:hypothetical protein [Acidobacteriota bacterium]